MTFTHVLPFKVIALLMLLGMPVAIAFMSRKSPPGDPYVLPLVYSLFVVLGLPLCWEGLRFAVTISPDGIDCKSPWRRPRSLRWSEVREVAWSQAMQ